MTDENQQKYDLDTRIPNVTLENGVQMPVVGLGTWKSPTELTKSSVTSAIRIGYRHIDCAYVYNNEKDVGEAIKEILSEGVVKRQDLFVVSKLWNDDHKNPEVACRRTLLDLGLDYLDAYLIHWPVAYSRPTKPNSDQEAKSFPAIEQVWKHMEGLVKQGLVRAIGVSNFSIKKIENLIQNAEIKPQINQVEIHPYWRNEKLVAWCKQNGIHATAYSPLGSPDSASMLNRNEQPVLLENEVVVRIAKKNGKTPGTILISWALQNGTSVLPKSTNPERIKSNLEAAQWKLPEEDFVELSSLPDQIRMVHGFFWVHEYGSYKSINDLWDRDCGNEEK